MIHYLDSSAVLRWVFKAPGYYTAFGKWARAASSVIADVECSRALDRLRLEGRLTDEELVRAHRQTMIVLDSIEIVSIDEKIIALAKSPFSILVRSLDALHVATALRLKQQFESDITIVTHDHRMKLLAQSCGLRVVE